MMRTILHQQRPPSARIAMLQKGMADYEFRFFRGDALCVLHVTSVADDTLACQRARLYLSQSPEYDQVEIRSGIRFMQKIAQADGQGSQPLNL